ncbi:enoyl-[acyl-carrier-protein] reductase (NADH) [Polaromonas sp. CG_9.11]|nr:enoyl-[acyl-carrier-protein] reductase (NADH) [Polaromonas sp. CG_9.11]
MIPNANTSSDAETTIALPMLAGKKGLVAKLAEPLMAGGGTLVTMRYYGAQKVIYCCGIMGPVKAALEASVRYLAAELGPAGIRVHAVSPGPI